MQRVFTTRNQTGGQKEKNKEEEEVVIKVPI